MGRMRLVLRSEGGRAPSGARFGAFRTGGAHARHVIATSVVLVLALVSADLAAGSWFLVDGSYRGRPLPPFATLEGPRRGWLDVQESAIERGVPPPLRQGFDAELGWVNRPGIDPDRRVAFNSIGARGRREYDSRPAEGVVRLACFGDSFTYGTNVADDAAWPAALESLDERIEALNFGVGGYGNDQALLRFRREGLHGAEVVVVGHMVEDIGRNVNRLPALLYTSTHHLYPKPRFLLRGGELRILPQPFASRSEVLEAARRGTLLERLREHEYWAGDEPWMPFSNIARILAADRAYRRRGPQAIWSAREPFDVTVELLATHCREAREAGARHVLVVVFPRAGDLRSARRGRPLPWAPLLDALARRGIACLDTTSALADEEGTVYAEAHLDRHGNAVVARELFGWLAERYEQLAR